MTDDNRFVPIHIDATTVGVLPNRIPDTAAGRALWNSLTDAQRAMYRTCVANARMGRERSDARLANAMHSVLLEHGIPGRAHLDGSALDRLLCDLVKAVR